MALIILTNASATNTVLLDSDRGDRENRYTIAQIEGGNDYALDEGDIMVPFDKSVPDALDGGIVTMTESTLNDISDLKTKNFVAGGLGIHFFTSNGILKANRAVVLDSETGKVGYVSSAGGAITGILRADTTNGAYERVMIKEGKSVTIALGGTVAEGDYLASDTTGRAIKAVAGYHSFAQASASGVVNGTQTVVLSYTTVS